MNTRHTFRFVISAVALFTCCAAAYTQSAQPIQYADQHPRLFFRADDLPRMRDAIQSIPMAKARYDRIKNRAKPDLEIGYPIPAKTTNYHWTRGTYSMTGNAAYCGFIYQVDGDEKYATWTRKLLLDWAANFATKVNYKLADDYHGKEVGAAGEGGNTMGYYFSGHALVDLAFAYDCVYEFLSSDDRDTIERGLFMQWVEEIESYDHSRRMPAYAPDFMVGPGQWNGANMCNMGLTAVGFALNKPRLYQRGVDNFKIILGRDLLADGFWIEEDLAYSATCLGTLFKIAWMAKSSGFPEDLFNMTVTHLPADQYDPKYVECLPSADGDVTTDRNLKMFLDANLDWQYPDFSPGNWGWAPGRGALKTKGSVMAMYLIGNAIYQDPAYALILDNVDLDRASLAPAAIDPIYFAQTVGDASPADTASRWYPHGKWIVLKSIEGKPYWNSDSLYAFMPYGHQRTKGLQPLTLDIFAFGKPVAPRITLDHMAQNLTKSYQLNEPAWNNVMVDGCNIGTFRERIDESTVVYHDFTEDVKVISAQLHLLGERRTELGAPDVERHPEEDRTMSRTLALTDTYLVDVVRITYDQWPKYKHNFDYVLHGYGELQVNERSVRNSFGNITATWKQDDGIGLRSTVLTAMPRGGTKIKKFTDSRTDYIVATRANYEEWFIVIHEPVKGESRIADIQSVAEQDDAVALKITFKDGRTDLLALRTKPGDKSYQWTTPAQESIELTGNYTYLQTNP